MRHRKKGRKLGTSSAHTKAMKKSLVAALLENDRIKTTEPRAKEIRGNVDKVITWAKRGDVHSRRLAIKAVGDKEIVREVFEKVEQGMFAGRNGGYTRIYKLGNRKGDNASMVIMELVTEAVAGSSSAASDKKADTKDKKEPKGKAAQKKAQAELDAKFKFDEDEADKAAEAAEASRADAEAKTEDEAKAEPESVKDNAEGTNEAAGESDEAAAQSEDVAADAADDAAEDSEAQDSSTEEKKSEEE